MLARLRGLRTAHDNIAPASLRADPPGTDHRPIWHQQPDPCLFRRRLSLPGRHPGEYGRHGFSTGGLVRTAHYSTGNDDDLWQPGREAWKANCLPRRRRSERTQSYLNCPAVSSPCGCQCFADRLRWRDRAQAMAVETRGILLVATRDALR